jgi:CheY-like chemotaxis protein
MSRRPTVLIVEDEFLIAMSASAVFAQAGFDTIEASNADEAIAVLQERDVDVIFTDIRMPGSIHRRRDRCGYQPAGRRPGRGAALTGCPRLRA